MKHVILRWTTLLHEALVKPVNPACTRRKCECWKVRRVVLLWRRCSTIVRIKVSAASQRRTRALVWFDSQYQSLTWCSSALTQAGFSFRVRRFVRFFFCFFYWLGFHFIARTPWPFFAQHRRILPCVVDALCCQKFSSWLLWACVLRCNAGRQTLNRQCETQCATSSFSIHTHTHTHTHTHNSVNRCKWIAKNSCCVSDSILFFFFFFFRLNSLLDRGRHSR